MSDLELQTATGIDVTLPTAGVGSRSYAYLIDWHIRIGIALVWVVAWLGFQWSTTSSGDRSVSLNSGNLMLGYLVPSLVYLLYHPVVELVMRGNTPGKRIAGIRCVDLGGNPPTSGAILLRNVMRLVDGLPAFYTVGVVTMIVTREQIRLGDMVAGTRVITAAKADDSAFDTLATIRNARVPPRDAELVHELLTRWHTLTFERRTQYAHTILQRQKIEPARSSKELRTQLEHLLSP